MEILQGVIEDDLPRVRAAVESGADIEVKDHTGATPLTITCFSNPWIAFYLLEKDANPHACSDSGQTPLSQAAKRGATLLVRKLLDQAVDVNLGPPAIPALWESIVHGRVGTARCLLHAGADPNAVHEGTSCLHRAVSDVDDADFTRLLVEKGADLSARDMHGNTPLFVCTMFTGMQNSFRVLVQTAKPDFRLGVVPLLYALCGREASSPEDTDDILAKIRILVDEGANVNEEFPFPGCTLLCKCKPHQRKVLHLLLSSGMRVQRTCACTSGVTLTNIVYTFRWNQAFIKALLGAFLDAGYPVDERSRLDKVTNMTALAYAATLGLVDVVEFLLNRGAQPIPPGNTWVSPAFVFAVQEGHVQIVSLLLKHGAPMVDPSAPLGFAILTASGDMAETLLQFGSPRAEHAEALAVLRGSSMHGVRPDRLPYWRDDPPAWYELPQVPLSDFASIPPRVITFPKQRTFQEHVAPYRRRLEMAIATNSLTTCSPLLPPEMLILVFCAAFRFPERFVLAVGELDARWPPIT